jgi:uncharacterized protein YnzC (UPF0291/DUF896 family)
MRLLMEQRECTHESHLRPYIFCLLIKSSFLIRLPSLYRFIWVRFQLDDICEELAEEGVRNALKRLPHGLEETFVRAMKKITLRGQAQVSAAKKLFMWLSCAKRVLSLEEMQEAVAILPRDKDLEKKKIPDGIQLLRACGSLIVYDSQENTIRFAHYSVQQFLSDTRSIKTIPEFHFPQEEADIEASRICMTYLNFPAFQVAVATFKNLSEEETRLLQLPTTEWVPQIANFSGNHPTLWNLFKGISGSGTSAPTVNFNKYLRYVEKPSKNLMDDYKLLDYVVKYWFLHTASCHLMLDDEELSQFRELAFERKLFFEFRPWPEGKQASNLLDAFIWALENNHETFTNFTSTTLSEDHLISLLGYNERYWCTFLSTIEFSQIIFRKARNVFLFLLENDRQSYLETHRKSIKLALLTGKQDVVVRLISHEIIPGELDYIGELRGENLGSLLGYNEYYWCALISAIGFGQAIPDNAKEAFFFLQKKNRQSYLETHRKSIKLALLTANRGVVEKLISRDFMPDRLYRFLNPEGEYLASLLGYNENFWCALISAIEFGQAIPVNAKEAFFVLQKKDRQSYLETYRKSITLAIVSGNTVLAEGLVRQELIIRLPPSELHKYEPMVELAEEYGFQQLAGLIKSNILRAYRS